MVFFILMVPIYKKIKKFGYNALGLVRKLWKKYGYSFENSAQKILVLFSYKRTHMFETVSEDHVDVPYGVQYYYYILKLAELKFSVWQVNRTGF